VRTFIAAAMTLLCCQAIGAQEDLVTNPGFEEMADEAGTPVGWDVPILAGVELGIDETVRHSGQRSARATGLDPEVQSPNIQAWRQNVGPLPEGALWVSVWVKTEDVTSGRINVLHRSAAGEVLRNQGLHGFSGTADWRELAGVVDPVEGAESLQLVMGLQKSTGTVWLDDVSVTVAAAMQERFGNFAMSPEEPQAAGSTVPVTLEFTLGEAGLDDGGSLLPRWENWRSAREFRLRNFSVDCEAEGARFDVSIPPRKTSWPPTPKPNPCIVTLAAGGPLGAGTQVVVRADLTYTPYTNVACALTGHVALESGSAPRPMDGAVAVRAIGGPAARLICVAEARPIEGHPGRVVVSVTDENGNPAESFRGTVSLSCDSAVDLPAEHAFTAADAGSHEFRVRFATGTVSRIAVTSDGMSAVSNPVLPRTADEPGIYFGDIHVHSELSGDGVGDPDDAYDYARRFLGLDLAALSDHSPTGRAWERATATANRHNAPGEFATFVAFEWSDRIKGHRNAYYRGNAGPQHPSGMAHNMETWWAMFDDLGVPVLTVPHHPNTESTAKNPDGTPVWGPMDWSVINHTYQRIVEICQGRGSFETPDGPIAELRIARADCGSSVQTALAKGHHLGFIGSTDTHSGRPGNGPARCAILSDRLEREALWDALHARACYGTTGAHMLILLTVNGEQMGRELIADDPAAARQIEWRAVGTGPIERVDLLRNNEVVESVDGDGADDLSGRLRFAERLDGSEWWYVRVIQADTEVGWSSPVWVEPAEG